MNLINEKRLKEIKIYPASAIEDIEINYLSFVEGFEINKISTENKNETKTMNLGSDIAIKLFKAAANLIKRENINEKDIHCCDVSDDINLYAYRAELFDNKLTIKYIEENRITHPNDCIEIGNLEKANRVIVAFFDMIKELENE